MANLYDHWRGHDDLGVAVEPKVSTRFASELLIYGLQGRLGVTVSLASVKAALGLPGGAATTQAAEIFAVLDAKGSALEKMLYVLVVDHAIRLVQDRQDARLHVTAGEPAINVTALRKLLELQ